MKLARINDVSPALRLALLAATLVAPGAFAAAPAAETAADVETVTWAEHVAPILYESCVTCHRPGQVAPMSLLTYDQARPWAKAIARSAHDRTMPPWFANPEHGEFVEDSRLSDEQIDGPESLGAARACPRATSRGAAAADVQLRMEDRRAGRDLHGRAVSSRRRRGRPLPVAHGSRIRSTRNAGSRRSRSAPASPRWSITSSPTSDLRAPPSRRCREREGSTSCSSAAGAQAWRLSSSPTATA